MSYSIEWTPQAKRAANNIQKSILSRFNRKLIALSKKQNPCEGLKKIHTKKGMVIYSLRDWEHRLLLTVDNGIMYIFVIGIGPRKVVIVNLNRPDP